MYDVLNEIVLDEKLCNFKTGEVSLSRQHIAIAKQNDIIIIDRVYLSFESMYEMQTNQIHFIYRCKHNHSNAVRQFYEYKQAEAILGINDSFKNLPYTGDIIIRVRMRRIVHYT